VELRHVECAPGLQVVGDDLSPSLDVVEPVDDAIAGVDDVEASVEVLGQVVDVGVDELGGDP